MSWASYVQIEGEVYMSPFLTRSVPQWVGERTNAMTEFEVRDAIDFHRQMGEAHMAAGDLFGCIENVRSMRDLTDALNAANEYLRRNRGTRK